MPGGRPAQAGRIVSGQRPGKDRRITSSSEKAKGFEIVDWSIVRGALQATLDGGSVHEHLKACDTNE